MLPALNTFLPLAEKIYNKKTSLDILQYICINKNKMLYTDLETFISIPLSDKRSFTLPIPILKKIINSKPHSLEIYLLDNNKICITYDNKRVTFSTVNVEEYPSETTEKFREVGTWGEEVFQKLFKQIPYASTDTLRPALNGIFIRQNKSYLSSVATNGHVLQYNSEMNVNGKSKWEKIMPVIPIKIVSQFNRGEVKVYTSENCIRFTLNNGLAVTSKLIKENYPDFKKVMPELNRNEIILQRCEILNCIKSAMPFSNSNNHQAVFQSCNGHVRVKAQDSEENTSFESSFEVENKKGKELHLALNLQLLEKTVKGMEDDQLHWHYNGPDDASVFTNGNGVQNLIMPIRLEES